MMRSTSSLRSAAIAVSSALIAAGLVSVAPVAVAAVVPPNPDATGELLVSRTDAGASSETFLTSDGQHVVFTSTERLSPADQNDHADVYLATAAAGSDDPFSGGPQLVSATAGGGAGNAPSAEPVASGDGRWVAFSSEATDLVPGGGTSGRSHVYVRDMLAGTTLRVQGSAIEPDDDSFDPDITDDGRRVIFTSRAQNLGVSGGTPGDTHVYFGYLERDSEGAILLSVDNAAPAHPQATDQPAIAGNGDAIVYRLAPADPAVEKYGTVVWRESAPAGSGMAVILDTVRGTEPAIDGNGNVIAFATDFCGGQPHIAAATLTGDGYSQTWRAAALGVTDVDNSAGIAAHPAVSSNGNVVAWETTQRDDDSGELSPLAEPIIRVESPQWLEAWFKSLTTVMNCDPAALNDTVDLGQGHRASLSAAGRTVAYSGASALAPGADEAALVFVTDDQGPAVTVTTVQGYTPPPRVIREVPIGVIPASAARGMQAAIAGAPIHQVPIHQVPIHQVPIHQVPIHQVPIHQVPIHQVPIHQVPIHQVPIHQVPIHQVPIHQVPIHQVPIYLDGLARTWAEILTGTPFEGESEEVVTVEAVLDWAAAALAPGSTATEVEREAADRIQALTVGESDGARTWAEILVGSPFEGQSELTVTLGEVLAWAETTVADPDATEAQRAAAKRIRALTLGDLGIDASGIDALSIASIVLGNAPLAHLEIPGAGTPTERWQALAAGQGLDVTVGATTPLAVLDWAGLDVTRTGIEQVTLGSLRADPTLLDATPLASLAASSLEYFRTTLGELPVSALSDPGRLFADPGTGEGLSGTLGSASWPFRDDATVADVITVVPGDLTLGTIFETLLDRRYYPWEQMDITRVDPRWASADGGLPCETGPECGESVRYRYTFDATPGQTLDFLATTIEVDLPTGTRGSGFATVATASPLAATHRTSTVNDSRILWDGNRVRMPLGDVRAGTMTELHVNYTPSTTPADGTMVGRATYTLPGETEPTTTEKLIEYWRSLEYWDDTSRNLDPANPLGLWYPLFEDTIYYGWISPSTVTFDGISNSAGIPEDEDFYLVPAPTEGHRVVVSTNASDGQLSISLYTTANTGAPLGTESAGPAPGTEVQTQPSGSEGDATRAGTDAGAPLLMAPANTGPDTGEIGPATLLDESVVPGDGTSQVSAAGPQVADAEYLVLRVASGDGRPSESAYTVRYMFVEEPAEVACPATSVAFPDAAGTPEGTDALVPGLAGTNTLYLFDQARFDQTWGAGSAAAVRQDVDQLDGVGGVRGAVIALDSSAAVQSARSELDENPCSMSRRADLTKEVNEYVTGLLDDAGVPREQITSIVIVGGDDILPLGPVAEHVPRFGETGHADDLRLVTLSDGSPCPASSVELTADPCATPLSAAAAAGYVLTDDPYGLPSAYDTAGGVLYVPNTAIGRLVESPDQISATLARFVAAGGEIAADSLATAGYGAWSELPEDVTSSLAWRSPTAVAVDDDGDGTWDRNDVARALGTTDASSARVVALNAHFDETRMLPGVPDAAAGHFVDEDLFTASDALQDDAPDADPLAGALVFTIGCHAANNLPSAYYPDRTDWVDLFSGAAGFVGNTGFGYANNVVTALSERLLGTYSSWLGVSVDGTPVTTGGALMRAKHSYLGGLGLYAGYDEKVLMQTVYYGLPMYTLEGSTAEPPAYKPAPALLPSTNAGLVSAGLSFSGIDFTPESADGKDYLSVAGEEQLVITGEPVLPRLVRELPAPADAGARARGALITGLTSTFGDPVEPLIAEPTAGVEEPDGASRTGMAFPSTFAHLSRQSTPEGDVDLLVVTPARVQIGANGKGVFETFTDFDVDVVYGDATSDDDVEPRIEWTGTEPTDGGVRVVVRADGTGSPVAGGLVLAQRQGSPTGEWQPFELAKGQVDGETVWTADVTLDGPFRWFVQVIDAAGNVAIDTGRGHLDVALADPPALASVPAVTLTAGADLVQAVEVTDADPTERLTAQYRWLSEGAAVRSGIAPVSPDADGAVRARIDSAPPSGGAFTMQLEVCRGDACSTTEFGVTVRAADPPSATLSLESSDDPVEPTSVLSASAAGSDPNGDAVTLAYRWLRNGALLDGASASTLDLGAIGAEHGDTFTIEVVPSDGVLTGGAARATMSVGYPPPPPANPEPPTIIGKATNDDGLYTAGSWSQSPVEIEYSCTPASIDCPLPEKVSADTTPAGVNVTKTVQDDLGRKASTSILVRVDGTDPDLAPAVDPATMMAGATPSVDAHATDAASGVVSSSCDKPDTSTVGTRTVACTATDKAGNSATSTASYTVAAPPTITVKGTNSLGDYPVGQWSASLVTVTFTCTGFEVSCPKQRTVSATGTSGEKIDETVTDAFGRSASASITVLVDRVLPILAPTATPTSVAVNGTVVLNPNATDAPSGIATSSCGTPDTSTTGQKTVTCTATDRAGNTATAPVTFTVTSPTVPRCGGGADRAPLQPLNADGSSVFLRSSGVPVIFRACDAAGKPIGTKNFVKSVTQTAVVALPKTEKLNELWYPPLKNFTYVKASGTWVGTVPTAQLAPGWKYTYRVQLADSTSFLVTFGVR